jgi:hypothetical protein
MRRLSIQSWAVKLVVVAAFAVLPVMGFAQDAQDGPRQGMMGGGRMVRGTVTAATADKLTVKTDEGETYQVVLTANTRLTRDRQPVKAADIKVGDGVGAMGVLDQETKTVHALFVGVIDAEQVKKARENMGKTYITGKVTAIDMDGLKITVMRPDNVSQVIGVDENTSFKRGGRGMAALASGAGVVDAGPSGGRQNGTGAGNGQGNGSGGESITFADVKVGDSIAGRGAVKNGVFVPTELGVVDPGAMRQRRRGAEGGTAGSTAGSTTPPASSTAPKAPTTPTTPQ